MIELTNVVKTYDTGTRALNGVSLKIEDGEFVFLVGPSGSGKSTIIKILTAELQPTEGSVHVNGFALEKIRSRAIPYLRRTLGVIFQDFRLIENKSVYDNVAFAMRVIGAPEREIKKRVPYVLELVGLENKGRRLPNELSGGELQMVLIARALAAEPQVLILDEPESNLDFKNQLLVLDTMQSLARAGLTCVFNTHYPAHALRRANKALLLGRNGKSLFGSTQDVVTEQNISDYFGVRAVIGSIETPDGAYADVIPVSAAQSEEAP